MSALVLNGSTSGQITLQPAAVAGTNTLTIPAVTGTVLTNPVSGTFIASTISSAAATPLLLQTNNGTTALTLDASQNATFAGTITGSTITSPASTSLVLQSNNGTTGITLDTNQNSTFAGTVKMASSFLRNRLINGAMQIAQRTTSATVTAGTGVPTASTGYPCVDRWFVYSTGANVTAAQVAGSGNNKNLLQITGAASVTAVGVGQRIEQLNSYDLAGQTCTLSVYMANSVLTTVTWTASYANTADTFGTIGTPSKTQIATGTFTVSSSLTQYTTNISIPSAATTGIEILFTVGAQTSGTWTIGLAQFELGSIATPFERRLYGQELALCQRYCYVIPKNTYMGTTGQCYGVNVAQGAISMPVSMRSSPTLTAVSDFTGFNVYTATATTSQMTVFSVAAAATNELFFWNMNAGSVLVAGNATLVQKSPTNVPLIFSAEL
jgi:hypothetical protein